jgi:soluble lytic murein transglycosylase-like protein
MRGLGRAFRALIAVVFGVTLLGASPAAAEPHALSPWDAQLYAAAFDAMHRGDFADAEAKLAQINDKCLVGMVEFEKLFHPTAYHASYAELVAWLEKYGDLPMAPRVRALARKRKAEMDAAADSARRPPEPAPGTRSPLAAAANTAVHAPGEVVGRTGEAVEAAGRLLVPPEPEPPAPKAAREALNAGDLQRAYDLAVQMGDNWIAALASWRRNRYDEAFRRFEMVALDPTEDVWVRAGGGFWAARAAIAKGTPEIAPDYLRIAARYPHTFYGVLAEHQLGLESSAHAGPRPYQFTATAVRPPLASDNLNTPAMLAFIRANARAKRAVALTQIGQRDSAGVELRMGMSEARDDATRINWTTLAAGLDASLSRTAYTSVDPSAYPVPAFAPSEGFQVDRALLYALMRRESRFNPQARSPVGAYGLMQLMPSTAAWLTGDSSLRTKPEKLWDPATNMRVGQAYIAYLGQLPYIHNDIFRIVAAYNGGPQPVMVTDQRLPRDADVLLFMESVPVPQTRVYIEEVMAAYWIYHQLLGEEPRSLDAVANGARTIPISMDYRPPVQATPQAPPQGAPPATPPPPDDPADPVRTGG